MSRYRDDRSDEYYGSGARSRGRGGEPTEDRSEPQDRGDYGRGSRTYSPRDREQGYDDPRMRERNRYGGGQDYDDYGRGGGGSGYSTDYSSPGGAGRGGYERDEYGRSPMYDEGRDVNRRSQRGYEGRGASRSHVRCRDIMTRDITVATRDTTLRDVAAMMRDEDTGVIPVIDRASSSADTTTTSTAATTTSAATAVAPAREMSQQQDSRRRSSPAYGRLVGLITDRDVVIRAIAEGKDINTTRAEEIMTEDVHTAQQNDRVIDAIRKMGDKQVRRIPIIDRDGNLAGIISMADVALETEEDQELANALEEISSGSSFWSKIFG